MAFEQDKQQPLNLERYLSLVLRRKWEIIFGAVPFLLAGVLFCLFSAKVYRTSATIIVVPQRVPESYVRSTITGDVDERIRGIWQEITSRTNLELIIQQFNLYPEARERLPMETVVEVMRQNIEIDSPRAASTNAFILSYNGKDPVLISKVTNALANMFIEENLKLREAQAKGTAEFLGQELETVYQDLREREESLKKYKTEHMGELPEQGQTSLAMLGRLQEQRETTQESIRRAEDRKLLLQRQLAEEEANLRTGGGGVPAADQGNARSEQAPMTLDGLRERLKDLRSRYTEFHPDIIALSNLIAKLEKEQGLRQALLDTGSGAEPEEAATETEPGVPQNAVTVGLRYQLKSLDLELDAMKMDGEKVRSQMAEYQKRIENIPKREQELIDLTRDYDNLRRTYESLLSRKIEAEQAAALERRQKGEQFRVIDPARIPETPFKPNVKKILAMVLMLAAGGGAGLALAREFLSKSFYDPEDVTKSLDLPVVACMPLLLTGRERRVKQVKTLAMTAAAVVCYSGVAGLLFVLWRLGAGAFRDLL
jgi:polysaccharide chain length determinant protein (PEP-CTERM system associated)